MGHLVNPLSFRLGITSFWKVNSVSFFNSRFNYSILYFSDKIIYLFIEWLFNYKWLSGFFIKKFKKFLRRRFFVRKRFRVLILKRKIKKQLLKRVFKKAVLFLVLKKPGLKCKRKLVKFKKYKFFSSLKRHTNKKHYKFKLFNKEVNLKKFKNKNKLKDSRKKNIRSHFFRPFVLLKKKVIFKRMFFPFKFKYRKFFKKSLRLLKLLIHRLFLLKNFRYKKSFRLFSFLKRYFLPELSHLVLYRSGFFSSKVILYFSNPILLKILSFRKLKKKINWKRFLISRRKKILKILTIFSKLKKKFKLKKKIFLFFKFLIFFFFFFNLNLRRIFSGLRVFFRFIKFKFIRIQSRKLLKIIKKSNVFIFNKYIVWKRFFFFPFMTRLRLKRNLFFLSKFSVFFFKTFFEKRWLFFINSILSKFFFNFKLNFSIYFIPSTVMTSKMLFNFFCRHLRRKKPINRIINMVLWDIKKQRFLVGFKILMAGRFTRKERALYKWIVHKRNPLSLYSSNLDYFSGFFKSRFGISSFKIWIFKK